MVLFKERMVVERQAFPKSRVFFESKMMAWVGLMATSWRAVKDPS